MEKKKYDYSKVSEKRNKMNSKEQLYVKKPVCNDVLKIVLCETWIK